MPVLNSDQQLVLGITPPAPGDKERDPETKVSRVQTLDYGNMRRAISLDDDQKTYVKKVLKNCWNEWQQNTVLLRQKLRRANDLMEGIKEPKTFPWQDCSDLHMPIIEIHITILHSIVSSTVLENDPVCYVKTLVDGIGEKVDTDIEQFLHWTCRIQLNIDSAHSDIYWKVYQDGLCVGDLDWVEEFDRRFEVRTYESTNDFERDFPTPQDAGLSQESYANHLLDIVSKGRIQVKIEEIFTKYRGPRLRVVELKDLIVIPTTSPTFEYAMFVGDAFVQRADYFRKLARQDWFDKDEVRKMLQFPGLSDSPDDISQQQDRIEGVAKNRVTQADEYYAMQGILKINLNEAYKSHDDYEDDFETEQMYLVVYHKDSDSLLRIEEYPYFHGRIKYIPYRFKKRVNRLIGQSIYDQLVDINDEIDTQHNQRIDSRTITTVPSFIKLATADFDPTRKDQRFYPGVTFKVNNFNEVKQFDIRQTDLGESMAEEQNLMYLADLRTGASQLGRTGQGGKNDPRAPAKKIMAQIQQSNQRVDDHIRELKIGTAECFTQVLELYYQFAGPMITFIRKDPDTQAFVKQSIARTKLRTRNTFIEVARTSTTDNPSMLVQKYLTLYQLLSNDPLIGGNIIRRRELIFRLLKGLREPNMDKLVPSIPDLLKELQAQQASIGGKGRAGLGEKMDEVGGRKKPLERGGDGQSEPPMRPADTSGKTVQEGP